MVIVQGRIFVDENKFQLVLLTICQPNQGKMWDLSQDSVREKRGGTVAGDKALY
jgi:hypothetical protein